MSNVLVEVQFYRKLREGFGLFCRTAGDVIAAQFEEYELKFYPGTGPSRRVSVLEHECRVRFGVTRRGGRESLVGRLLFERVLGAEISEFLFEVTFDHLLYVIRQPAEREYLVRGRVPGEDVPAPAGDIGRQVDLLDRAADGRRHNFAHERPPVGILRQLHQMPVFGPAKPQRAPGHRSLQRTA